MRMQLKIANIISTGVLPCVWCELPRWQNELFVRINRMLQSSTRKTTLIPKPEGFAISLLLHRCRGLRLYPFSDCPFDCESRAFISCWHIRPFYIGLSFISVYRWINLSRSAFSIKVAMRRVLPCDNKSVPVLIWPYIRFVIEVLHPGSI